MKLKISAIIAVLLLSISISNAQFLTKISVGVKGGVNFTIPSVITSFSTFENLDTEKTYGEFYNNFGSQFAFIVNYSLSEKMSLDFCPGIFTNSYKYENMYTWSGSDNLTTTYNFEHSLQYIDLPLSLKFDFRTKKLQPYIKLGFYYGLLLNSTSYITRNETGDFGTFDYEKEQLGNNNYYINSKIGASGGLGLSYRFVRSKIGLETGFRYGFNNITDSKNRYSNSQITGKYYDIPDDLKFMNLSVSLTYSISLKCVKQTIPPRHREF